MKFELDELYSYMNRSELAHLKASDRRKIERDVLSDKSDYPVGRKLALVLLKFNQRRFASDGKHINVGLVSDEFINWLYYY